MMTLEELYSKYLECEYVTTDSREIEGLIDDGKSIMFFALTGNNFNGNDFVVPVIEMGAKWAISSDKSLENMEGVIIVDDVLHTMTELAILHRSKLNHPHIAITGSNGKTTTKELTAAALNKEYICYATVGNLNNHIGVPLTILRTPKDANISIIEMGANHRGEISHLCNIAQPNYGLITNIGRAHLDGFGGDKGVRKAKGELYDYLAENNGIAIYLEESEELEDMVHHRKGLQSKSYTITDIIALEGNKLTLRCYDTIIKSNLVGDYNIYNIGAAIAIGLLFDIKYKDIVDAIEEYHPTNNRSQLISVGNCDLIVDAYNANPTSMELALMNFDKMRHNNKVLILGEMKELGTYSAEEHLKIVRQVNMLNSKILEVIYVGEGFNNILKGNSTEKSYIYFNNVDEVSQYIMTRGYNNALVLIKGSNSTKLYTLISSF